MENKEIECRFLEIDKGALIQKLRELEAEDRGEVMLEETIVYNQDLSWSHMGRRVRIRKSGDKTTLTYKEKVSDDIDGNIEIEFGVDSAEKAEMFLEKIGLRPSRKQQKLRHTFVLDDVVVDIDTWPRVPTYVELEGNSEEEIKAVVAKIGYDWSDATYELPGAILDKKYGISVVTMGHFTFDRFE